MPKIKTFTIKNFRGARDVKIDANARISNKIITLVGLNESGKTTILEAISHFPTNDSVVSSIFRKDEAGERALSLLPIHLRANYTGSVQISGEVELDEVDRKDIRALAKSMGHELDADFNPQIIEVTREYKFLNGDYVSMQNFWNGINLRTKFGRSKKFVEYVRPDADNEKDLWLKAVNLIEEKLPNIVYFPNFLVDVPKRIYLKYSKGEDVRQRYYRKILSNGVDSLGEGLSIGTHVVDRIDKFRTGDGTVAWASKLRGDSERQKIDPVFSKMSLALTREVLGSWGRIFHRPLAAKSIKIEWEIDPDNNLPYAEITVSDGESTYYLHERSLGFRWFFSFLLFTRFGGERGRPNLFLFDEPAASLHARAQAELLDSFGRLVNDNNSIIYSTHSHHMINPEWLSGAYIVENTAVDFERSGGDFEYDVRNTNIKATGYRRFVGENGSRVSYFQPVIERLQYIEPALVASGPQVMVEGVSDFYALSYVLAAGRLKGKISIVPGGGAGSLSPMISIALSRGVQFITLLDDDKAGRSAAQKYRDQWKLSNSAVMTLSELDGKYAGRALEGLLSKETLDLVTERFGNHRKETIGLYLAEAAATKARGLLDPRTVVEFDGILNALAKRLGVS